ncbi:hypothetical protein OH77DRAFT_1415458 [Trametes cingulata]|nr:hypothetical protein OH77DRAFT_1415458 [Trametes cingulata]
MDFDSLRLLDDWKRRVLRDSDIPYEYAVGSLFTLNPVIEARPQTDSRWTFYIPGTDNVAVFSHCGVFSMADDYYTGNLVPHGETCPDSVMPERMERYASYRCHYSYVFDTVHDKSFFELQQDHICSVKEFNPENRLRRSYQTGQDPNFTKHYWMRTPMFLRINKGDPKPHPPSYLHKWVTAAERRAMVYYANPARPSVMALEEGVIRDIRKCEPDRLVRGDIVVVTFTVSFVLGPATWFPQILLLELVRVGEGPLSEAVDAAAYAVPVVDARLRPALADGEALEGTVGIPILALCRVVLFILCSRRSFRSDFECLPVRLSPILLDLVGRAS